MTTVWQYTWVNLPDNLLLDKMGNLGWELVSVTFSDFDVDFKTYNNDTYRRSENVGRCLGAISIAYFKRAIPANAEQQALIDQDIKAHEELKKAFSVPTPPPPPVEDILPKKKEVADPEPEPKPKKKSKKKTQPEPAPDPESGSSFWTFVTWAFWGFVITAIYHWLTK